MSVAVLFYIFASQYPGLAFAVVYKMGWTALTSMELQDVMHNTKVLGDKHVV
jgi:hypothetical protein